MDELELSVRSANCLKNVCAEKTTLVRDADPLACIGWAPQSAAAKWVSEHPNYSFRSDRDHPVRCAVGEERGA